MKFSTTLLSSVIILFSTFTKAVPAGEEDDEVSSTIITESGTLITTTSGFQYLSLRDDFDPTHPALNTTHILSLLGTNATIPHLPGVPYSDTTIQGSYDGYTWKTKCETTGGSPSTADANLLYEQLERLGKAKVFCCHIPSGDHCSPLWWKGSAISDLCDFNNKNKKFCVKCGHAAAVVKDLIDKCSKDGKVGGYGRSSKSRDINLYHTPN